MRLARHGKKGLAWGLALCMMCGIAGCGGVIPTQGEAPQETPLTMQSAAFQLGVRDHLGGYQYGTWQFNGYEQETFDSLIASVEDDLKLLDELEAQPLSEEEKTECKILREALENEKTLYQNRLYWEPNKTFFGEHA